MSIQSKTLTITRKISDLSISIYPPINLDHNKHHEIALLCILLCIIGWPDYWHADYWHADDWHADNWHGGQLACGKLALRTIGIDFLYCFLFNYFNVLTNNKFHFQIKNL